MTPLQACDNCTAQECVCNEPFHCCMDCGPDVVKDCRSIGCQVDKLVADEERINIASGEDVVLEAN